MQGLSVDEPLVDPKGVIQSHAFGITFGRFALQQQLRIVEVHASATKRTMKTRDLALEHILGLTVAAPTQALWEHRKGVRDKGGLEGVLRTEAYPTDAIRRQAAENPDFRHGTLESGGETPNEAGRRWRDRWFFPLLGQENFRPRTDPQAPIPTMVAFGHNLVTARGVSLLMHAEDALPPVSDRTYKVANATALLLAENSGEWSVLPEPLVPTPADFEEARAYIAESIPHIPGR